MQESEILELVENYVKTICQNDVTGHDWWHIKRVYNNAMLINQKEKANEFIITMIVYLHDLYDHKFYKGDIAKKLEETLKELKIYDKLSKEDTQNIIHSCTYLGYSSNFNDKKELSKEGKIAQDADRLDGLGAMGISRTFAYSGSKGKPIYNPHNNSTVTQEEYKENGSNTAISHFYDKLLKIKDLMNTETAKNIAIERHKYVEEFLEEFLNEWNGIK